MFDHKIRVSTSLIGTGGYNNHAQSFFKELAKYCPLEIRNFTVGDNWQEYSDEPHNNEPYIDDDFKTLLTTQSLWSKDKKLVDLPIYSKYPNAGKPTIDLILNTNNHHYFYDDYNGYKIAYCVWESTEIDDAFFKKLLEFDELWVPSYWQEYCIVKQGYPSDKVFVIPEGVDIQTFNPEPAIHQLTKDPNRFTFGLFGRWDYRKSTKEIIEAFLAEFNKDEAVDLIISVDNKYSGDNFESTEKRLEHYHLNDNRIKVLHYPPRQEYVNLLKSINVFVSCSRSEGWNLPLIEAMSCGTPSIYSNCSGQLQFASNKGIPVKIIGTKPTKDSDYNHFNNLPGEYYEPDFNDLRRAMRDAYVNYEEHKKKAMLDADAIHAEFNWTHIAKQASFHLISRTRLIENKINKKEHSNLKVNCNFVDGPNISLSGESNSSYIIKFIDNSTNTLIYNTEITSGMWAAPNCKYYRNWKISIEDKETNNIVYEHIFDLTNKKVHIMLGSKSLGDTLAWFPAIEEFRKKHNCEVYCTTFHNEWFIANYPNLKFAEIGTSIDEVYASYSIGWYYNDETVDFNRNPVDFKNQPMQKTAFDILGLDYKETKPIIEIPNIETKNQIAIAIHATAQPKYWNKVNGWQAVVDWCNNNGYEVVLLSREEDEYMGNSHPTGIRKLEAGPLSIVKEELAKSKAFIGIGSGLSWLSWAIGIPTILISGFSYSYTETKENTFRISAPSDKCSGCFNKYKLDRGNWNWCPEHENTTREFECTRYIEPEQVIFELKKALSYK